jgi:hypothetical protein
VGTGGLLAVVAGEHLALARAFEIAVEDLLQHQAHEPGGLGCAVVGLLPRDLDAERSLRVHARLILGLGAGREPAGRDRDGDDDTREFGHGRLRRDGGRGGFEHVRVPRIGKTRQFLTVAGQGRLNSGRPTRIVDPSRTSSHKP